jgi:hypothetical protein
MSKRPIVTVKFTDRDRKDLSRLVGKYGRARVRLEARTIPLPRSQGRPPADAADDREYLYDAVHCLREWTDEYKAAWGDGQWVVSGEGEVVQMPLEQRPGDGVVCVRSPTEAAYRDLYAVTVAPDLRIRGHYERWRQTTARKLRRLGRRDVEAYLERGARAAVALAGKKMPDVD